MACFFSVDHHQPRASSPPHLEPEVTITASKTGAATNRTGPASNGAASSSSKKSSTNGNNSTSSQLPVLHIPEYIPTSFGGSVHKKTKKPSLTSTCYSTSIGGSSSGGHPGMPNGLLRLSTSLQPRAGVGTTVTPKDQSARLGKKKECWKILNNRLFHTSTNLLGDLPTSSMGKIFLAKSTASDGGSKPA